MIRLASETGVRVTCILEWSRASRFALGTTVAVSRPERNADHAADLCQQLT